MNLEYNKLPDVNFSTNKKLDGIINVLETLHVNLINEIMQPIYLEETTVNTNDYFEEKDYIINNEIKYNNYLVHGPFIGEPNHMDIDEGIAIKYGMGNIWVRCVATIGKWYQENVLTCNSGIRYECELFNDKYEVIDTNLGFFKACLLYYAMKTHQDKYDEIKNTDFTFFDFMRGGKFTYLINALEFTYKDVDEIHLYEIEYEEEHIEMGDITINIYEDYGEIYFGKWKEIEFNGSKITEWGDNKKHNYTAMSWNNINNNMDWHYEMPCPIKQSAYNVVLHYNGYKYNAVK